jgi:tellurite resistance protein
MAIPRIPPNLFGIPFGIAGLAEAWQATTPLLKTPQAVPDALDIVAAAAWLLLLATYALHGPRQLVGDLHDRVLAPFVPVASITGMLLSVALAGYEFDAGRALVVVFLVMTIAVGGWLTGQWFVADLDQDSFHPGYFLPTVAGGLIGAASAAEVHLRSVAEASFGIGIICWFLIGSTIVNRLFFRPMLPPSMLPTMAIEVAPPVVAGVAYSAISGGAANPVAYALGGYAVLMIVVQLRLLPLYSKLRFTPGFWAFTFAYSAVATDALEWITLKHPRGANAYAVIVIALISLSILAISIRTVMAVLRGQFLPKPVASNPST